MNQTTRRFLIIATAALLLGALFPWLFIFHGNLKGIPISTRALGDAGGIVLMLAGLAGCFFQSVRTKIMQWSYDIDNNSKLTSYLLIAILAILYFAVVCSHKLRAHSFVCTHAYDLGFFSNICWNTAHGNWFWSSEIERNFMAVHVNWILWPLSLLYRWGADSRMLLICQTAFITLSIPFLWILVRHITGSSAAGLLASLLFICSPFINHAVSNDFHPDLWLLPCLFGSIVCWRYNKPVGTLGFALLALLAKEDASVVVCGWGLLLFFKRWRWTGFILLALSLIVFIGHTRFFTPLFLDPNQKSLLFDRYAFFKADGSFNPSMLISALIYRPVKFLRLIEYLLPTGGAACFAPSFLIPALISTFPHLLSQANTQLNLADIYSIPSQPFLFTAASFGSLYILNRIGHHERGRYVAFLIFVAGCGLLLSPAYFKSKNLSRLGAFNEMKRLIPPDASLLAQQNLFPHFDTRRYIQIFPVGNSFAGLKKMYLTNPDFIVCDRIGNALPFDSQFLADAIARYEADSRYKKIFEKDGFIVFRRADQESLMWKIQNI